MYKIGCVITHYDGQEYLDLCLNSLLESEDCELEVVVVSSALEEPKVDPRVTLYMRPRNDTAPQNANFGTTMLKTNPKFLMSLNDDVIVPRKALRTMAYQLGNNKAIFNPLSNCDKDWLYFTEFIIESDDKTKSQELPRFFEKDILEGYLESIKAIDLSAQLPVVVPVSFLCLYASLMHTNTWKEIGGYDGTLRSGSDVDFCIRARQKGYQCFFTTNAFILHFGGIVSKKIMTDQKRDSERLEFKAKWGFMPEEYK